jgi:hypothetical protein
MGLTRMKIVKPTVIAIKVKTKFYLIRLISSLAEEMLT